MPTTRGRQPLEVAQSQRRAIPAPGSNQSAAEKHRQADFAIDKHNAEAVLDRLNVPRGHDTVDDDSEEQAEGEHSCVIVGMIQFASFTCDLAICTFLIVATCSLQNLTVIVSMMEFARLWRFAVCNIYVRLQFASWRPFFEKSFFLSEFRTRCENIFLGGDTTGSRGGEGERERVPDGSNSSSDEDASDYHGSEESDGASEAQSGNI